MKLGRLIAVARGKARADLILKNARVINTFTGDIEQGNVAIYQDRIAGVGDYSQARQVIDLRGDYLAPGLINGHTHIESSMLHPSGYAQAVVPRGTLAVITDLQEIANVCGSDGIKFVMEQMQELPLDMYFMAPSCVPATPLETSGAELDSEELRAIFAYPGVLGLGEMMNFPGVIAGDEQVLDKIAAATDKVIDGHAPGLRGKELNAYIAAGIMSDHESTELEEGREKLQKGMYLMIREGSSEKNLEALLPLVTDKTYPRCLFVVDDRSCVDLLREGDIDAVVRKAISLGMEPVRALQLATINVANYFRLRGLGAIAPGYKANFITIPDLTHFHIDQVFYHGELVARHGLPLFPVPGLSRELTHTVHMKPIAPGDLRVTTSQETYPVIQIVPGQILTRKVMARVKTVSGEVVPDFKQDIMKLVVVERHRASGNIGLGLVQGFGLHRGAFASSIAHDSHNIIAVGTSDRDIMRAIKEIEALQGGLAVSEGGQILNSLPLPVAGLLSLSPLEETVVQLEKVEAAVASLGELPPAPFSLLSFLALPVIPELRLTDRGLVDVTEFKLLHPA